MPRTKLLVSALALALSGATVAQAQTFSSVVSFGDSLTDAGEYAIYIPGANSFTTNPDDVWAQVLADAFNLSSNPSDVGGSNYAYGGAPTSFSVGGVPFPLQCVPNTLPCKSVSQQMSSYLGSNGGHADPNALYTYWAGANDLFNYLGAVQFGLITAGQAQTFTGASALTAVGQIGTLQALGARNIVVLNLPDIGVAPDFKGTSAQTSVSGLVFVYNSTFNGGLATLQDGIIPINAYGFLNEVLANPGEYGFSNSSSRACGATPSLFCSPASYVTPDANETYVFADGVHPSGAAHRMLANVVVATIKAPGQVSMAGEVPLQMYDDHSNVINNQIFGMTSAARSPGETNAYGHLQYSQTSFKASSTTSSMDSDLFVGTFGADVRYSENISLGAAISVGNSNGNNAGASIGGTEVLFSAYGVAHFGAGYFDMILSGGSNNMDIDRSIVLGPTTRVEKGSTNVSHTAVEIGAGWTFGAEESFKHGPYASIAWQKVQVDGYKEDSSDSTSMYFDDFRRNAAIARLGYQLRVSSGNWQPYGRIAWATDSDASTTRVQAGSNSMNGHFTLDGFQAPKDWTEADVGVNYALADNKSLSFSYRGRFSDDTQDLNSVDLGFRMEF